MSVFQCAPCDPSEYFNFKAEGKFKDGETIRGHPKWYAPKNTAGDMGIMVNNSLTGGKMPFNTTNGRRILWYTCGPTVYDACHMGHARAYLTFDILRRILEDYFHYEIMYVRVVCIQPAARPAAPPAVAPRPPPIPETRS
jgi:hypothetical protein